MEQQFTAVKRGEKAKKKKKKKKKKQKEKAKKKAEAGKSVFGKRQSDVGKKLRVNS